MNKPIQTVSVRRLLENELVVAHVYYLGHDERRRTDFYTCGNIDSAIHLVNTLERNI